METFFNIRVILSVAAVMLFFMTGWLNRVQTGEPEMKSWDLLAWWYEGTAGIVFSIALWATPSWMIAGGLGGLSLLGASTWLREWIRKQLAEESR